MMAAKQIVLAACVMLAMPLSVVAGDFEGVIHSVMNVQKGDDAKQTKTIKGKTFIKGNKMRMEMDYSKLAPEGQRASMEGAAQIIDHDAKKTFFINPAHKTVLIWDQKAIESGGEERDKKFTVTRTGKSDTIAGYPAEQFIVKHENGTTGELWGAKIGVPYFNLMYNPSVQQKAELSGLERTIAKDYFPMRWVFNGKDGKPEMTMEVTKVEKKSLTNDLFAVPAGYKTLDQNGMLQQQQKMMEQMKAMRERKGSVDGAPDGPGSADIEKMLRGMRERQGAGGGTPGGPSAADIEKMIREKAGHPSGQ